MSILIADPKDLIYNDLKQALSSQKVKWHHVEEGLEAQEIIKDQELDIQGIIVSSEISNPNCETLLKTAVFNRTNTPIIYINNDQNEFEELKIDKQIKKKLVPYKPNEFPKFEELVYWFCPNTITFNPKYAFELSNINPDIKDKEIERADNEFVGIESQIIFVGKKSLFDLYVKIKKGKYVKILNSNESLDDKRVESYRKRGVKNFFIRKEAFDSYYLFCDKLLSNVAGKESITPKKRKNLVIGQGELVLETVREFGVNEKSYLYAKKYVNNLNLLISSIKEKNYPSILDRFNDHDHCHAVTFISCLIAREMGIEEEKSLENLGVGCFFHDIGLFALAEENEFIPEDFKDYDEEKIQSLLSGKRLSGPALEYIEQIYLNHAEKGGQVIDGLKGISEFVPQIVRQHHSYEEISKGLYVAGQIHPLAGVLELANDFSIIASKYQRKSIQAAEFKLRVRELLSRFPSRITNSFLKVFVGTGL